MGGFFWVGLYCQPWFEDEGLGVFVGPEIPAELVEAGIPEIEDHGAIQAHKQNIRPFLHVEGIGRVADSDALKSGEYELFNYDVLRL